MNVLKLRCFALITLFACDLLIFAIADGRVDFLTGGVLPFANIIYICGIFISNKGRLILYYICQLAGLFILLIAIHLLNKLSVIYSIISLVIYFAVMVKLLEKYKSAEPPFSY